MKTIFVSAALALCIALLTALSSPPAPIESQILRAQLENHFPTYVEQLTGEPLEIQAFFVDHADNPLLVGKARLALVRYPAMTQRILTLYGDEETFQEVLANYGDLVIPPIWYFLENKSTLLQAKRDAENMGERVKRKWATFWNDEKAMAEHPDTVVEEVSPEERGWHAILQVKDHGHDFLGQFVTDENGQIKRVQTERALEAVTSFFASGIRNVETKWKKGEEIELGDAGWAALDLAVGVSALKVLRISRATAKGTQAMSFSQRNAALGSSLIRGSTMGLRVAKYGAPVVLGYIAITHPSVLNSIFKAIAEAVGLPIALVQIVGWALVLFPVVFIAMTVLKPLTLLLSGAVRLLVWMQKVTQSTSSSIKQA